MDSKKRAIDNRDLSALIFAIVHENSSLIVLILSLLGGMNQYFNLFAISPSVTQYYSPTQALIDGILFLSFNIAVIFTYLICLLIYQYLAKHFGFVMRIILFVINTLFLFYLMYVLLVYGYFWMEFLLVPIFLASSVFMTEEEKVEDKVNIKRSSPNEKSSQYLVPTILLLYFFFSFLGFFFAQKQVFMSTKQNVYNYKFLESKVNQIKNGKFILTYNNGTYLFFKDPSNGTVAIIKVDAALIEELY